MNGDYKKIKLIATDIDGTLVNSKGKISSKTKEILLQWQKHGFYCTFYSLFAHA